jgi:hypothetical protein
MSFNRLEPHFEEDALYQPWENDNNNNNNNVINQNGNDEDEESEFAS